MVNVKRIFLIIGTGLILNMSMLSQQGRGAGVRVKNQQTGKIEEVKLYDASYALVIGEADYTNGWDNLAGVKTDVAAIRSALEKHGFQVKTLMNPKRDELTGAVDSFIDAYGYTFGNRLLIYFAGHGYTTKTADGRDSGYFIPADAPLPSADALGFQRKAVSMDTIQFYARKIQAKHALFVFDSCFSGKLVSRGEVKIPPFIIASVGQSVRQFITSGAANQTVPDQSDFRKLFVRGLDGAADEDKDGFILGSELAKYLKRELTNYSQGRQTPQYGKILDVDLDQGDFVFVVPPQVLQAVNEPKDAMGYTNRAIEYGVKGNIAGAEADYAKAIELDPTFHWIYFYRGMLYRGLGDNEKALADFTKVIELKPDHTAAYQFRGEIYEKRGELDKAIIEYTKAVNSFPDDINPYLFRAEAYEKKGDYNRAIADYTTVIKLDPKYPDAYKSRAVLYEKLGRRDLAGADRKKCSELGGGC